MQGRKGRNRHAFCFDKVNGKQNLTALFPFNGINLGDWEIRIFYVEILIIRIGAVETAGPVHFEMLLFLSWRIAYLAWEVKIPCFEKLIVHQPVNGTSG